MPKVTQHQLDVSESSIIDVYKHLEQQLFEDFVNRLQQHGLDDVDQTNVLQWQMEVMNDLHLVNSDVINEASKATGIARTKLIELFQRQGYKVVDQEYKRATTATGRQASTMQVNTTKQVLDGYLNQTFQALDNNVNQTLLSTNYGTNAATKTYQQIVKETTADVLAGLRTPDQALKATIYRWRDKGIDLGLVDKGGHKWGLESYARLVVDNTSRRAFQAVRDQAADDVGVDTFVMSSHEASRAACAPIQGKLVTTRPDSFTDARTGEHFESLYDHGYGTPSGTFGINCHHIKWLYVPGASSNNQPQYNAAEAIAKGDMVAKQRELERRIRAYKQKQALADKMNDPDGVTRNQLLIRRNQAALRKLVSDHSYLHRDYTREKVFARPE
ncbi:phage minor capsid protein [Lacticaseibacillus sp. 53-4]|uniref:phage minor capsid protein n=1 Tax=Lacticaseibacillus sp. 53-4 TaxID=2799575 RepID=UPI00194217FF|nr:phage minor capsid protein [Lacticaseibacillus sp. 53-4]